MGGIYPGVLSLCTALITFGIVLSLNAQPQPSPVQPPPVKRTILQRADVPGTNLEIIYATLEIAAGFKAGRHSHPGVVMAQIAEGDFWLHVDGQPEQIVRPGPLGVCVPSGPYALACSAELSAGPMRG